MSDSFLGLTLNDRYLLNELLGAGGQGHVYQARDLKLERQVAIKLLPPKRADDEGANAAFLHEAKTVAQLEDDHILRVYDLVEITTNDTERIYLVMYLARGGTLAQRIARGPLGPVEAARVLNAVCGAMDFAHSRNVLHLDLKPLNILFDDLTNKKPLITDFGLAKLLETTSHVKADTQIGSRHYMAREQFYGGDVRRQTDVHALGVVLYEMLIGKLPKRDGENDNQIVYPTPLPSVLTEAVRTVISKATADKYSQRYGTAGELAEAFSAAVRASGSGLATVPTLELRSFSRELREEVKAAPPAPSYTPESVSTETVIALRDALRALGNHCEAHPNIQEREVVTLAFNLGIFEQLGYSMGRRDVLLEEKNTDVFLRAPDGHPLGVIEFKRPNAPLQEAFAQLDGYVYKYLPDFGMLMNGHELWLYRREGRSLQRPAILSIALKNTTDNDAEILYRRLSRRTLDLTKLLAFESALRTLADAPLEVRGPNEPGGNAFLDRLALRRGTPFGRLVGAMYTALPLMLERSPFTKGAYNFWRRIYARNLDAAKTPKSWIDFMGASGREDLYQFMFALESAYAVASRLLLARAMENQQFPDVNLADVLVGRLRTHQRQGKLPPAAYADGIRALFEAAGNQAFQAIFASDIFDWWHDLWEKPAVRGEDWAIDVGERLAEAVLAIVGFDFRPMSGDLLGGLYQSYFDAETRKALGEFYTPPEVVDFILDQVGYTPGTLSTTESRLLDPACGSGTFLVHALQRYLKAAVLQPPARVLDDLLGGLKIVGFDVNPFAVLMAQANYAAQIIPLYAKALRQGEVPVAYAIPVLRTDSLRQEYRESEEIEVRAGSTAQQSMLAAFQTADVTTIRAELPVEVAPGTFFQANIPVPRYDNARAHGWVGNQEEYFTVLRVLFEAVGSEQTSVEQIRGRLEAIGRRHFANELAHYLQPAVKELVITMRDLKNQYDDGRFLKTLSDLALALVLKNDVSYSHVVTNPPYIRVQEIPETLRAQWLHWYRWAEGNFDAYIPFMERAIAITPRASGPQMYEWLAPGGRLGLITSNRFTLANYATTMRAELPKKATIDLLFDFRDSRVFEDALNYPAILVVRRLYEGETPPEQFTTVRVFDDPRRGAKELLDEAEELIAEVRSGAAYLRSETTDAFLTATSDLHKQAWLAMPPFERRVFHKLEAAATVKQPGKHKLFKDTPRINRSRKPYTIRLEDLTLTQSGAFQGVATGDDASLVFRLLEDRGATLKLRPKGAGDPAWVGPTEVEIERAVLRPWLFGRDVERWHIDWDSWYIFFPYAPITALEKRVGNDVEVTRYRLIPNSIDVDEFRKRDRYVGDVSLIDQDYPAAWAYVSHPIVAKRLRARERGRYRPDKKDGHVWYGAARPQNLEYFELAKLVLQVSSTGPDIAMDPRGDFVFTAGGTSGVYGIVFNNLVSSSFCTGLFNSQTFDFYLKHVSTVYSGKAYSYGDQFIKQFPIKLPLTKREQHQANVIASLAETLTATKGALRAKQTDWAAFPGPQTRALPASYNFYRLEQIASAVALPKTFKRVDVGARQLTLEGKYTLRIGRGRLEIPHEAISDLIDVWLRVQRQQTLISADLLDIRVPSSEHGCRLVIQALAVLEDEIAKLDAQLSTDEVHLDNLVATYYGLDADDRAVVTEFLARF